VYARDDKIASLQRDVLLIVEVVISTFEVSWLPDCARDQPVTITV
jgi:hypothetical protein